MAREQTLAEKALVKDLSLNPYEESRDCEEVNAARAGDIAAAGTTISFDLPISVDWPEEDKIAFFSDGSFAVIGWAGVDTYLPSGEKVCQALGCTKCPEYLRFLRTA